MKALVGGCFSVFALFFVFGFLIQYPAIFWTLIIMAAGIFTLGLFAGVKQSKRPNVKIEMPVKRNRTFVDDDEEGDIRHHYNYGGTPMSIDNPGTIQNQSMSFGDHEDEERG